MRARKIILNSLLSIAAMLAFAAPSNAAFGVEQMWGVGGGAGGLGLGAGQLTTPQVAAIAPNGEIYVAEYEDCSIRVYSAGGQALRQWGGTCAESLGSTDLYKPISLAVDDRGRAWVGELGNGRISVFDEKGRLLKRIGYNTGTFDDFFSQVTSLDVRSVTGGVELYVADTYKNRVSKFIVDDPVAPVSIDPQFAWTAGTDVDSVASSTGFEVCTAIADCKDGVADAASDSLANVADIDLTADGATLVATANYRYAVELNAATGAHQASFDLGAFNARQIAPAAGGGFWAGRYGAYSQLFGYDATGTATGTDIGSASPSAAGGNFSLPLDVTTDASSNILVTDTDMHRVSLFTSAGAYVRSFGKSGGIGWQRGSDDSEFALPRDITITPSGGFWVSDSGNNQIKGFTNAGAAYSTNDAATSGAQGGQFSYPSGVAASADGFYLYVADTANRRVQRLDVSGGGAPGFQRMRGKDVYIYGVTGTELCQIAADCKAGVSGTGAGEFSYPLKVEISPLNGEVAVVDGSPGNQIQFFDASLSYLRTVTGGTTAFSQPVDIDFESDGRFWVVDQFNGRIGRFEPNGVLIGWLQVHGTPSGAEVIGSELHVAQAGMHRVAVYDLSTTLLASWPPAGGYVKPEPTRTYGALGSNRGQLYKPERLAASGTDVYVADTGNNRIVRFGDDAAAANNQISITAPLDAATIWNRGTEVVEYSATDADGNTLTCSPGSGSAVPLNAAGSPTTITVSCDDPLSATAVTSSVTVTRQDDFDPPVISDLLPASGTVTSVAQAVVSYTVSDADASPDCDLASGSTVALTPGLNTLSVTCTDFLGNTATASTLVTYNPPTSPGGGDGTPPPGAASDPVATIKLAKLSKFKGKVSATVTCDRACPLVFTVAAKVGSKKYKARATKQLTAAGSARLTAKFKRSATKAILAARKKPKLSWTLSYGGKSGLSGSVKSSK